MKLILSLLTLFLAVSIQAQSEIKKDIGEFSTLKVYDLIDIEMIKSNSNYVEIAGTNKNDVVVVNRNGKLKIRMNLSEILDGNKTTIKLYYSNTIDLVDVNEGATVTFRDEINQFELELKAQEGGKINAEADLSFLKVKSVSGGEISLDGGKSKKQDITINTGGIFNGESFKTAQTEVSISAGGEAYVNASDTVEVRIKAGGDVYIYGKPKYIDEKRVFGGRIKQMDK